VATAETRRGEGMAWGKNRQALPGAVWRVAASLILRRRHRDDADLRRKRYYGGRARSHVCLTTLTCGATRQHPAAGGRMAIRAACAIAHEHAYRANSIAQAWR